MIFSPPTLVPRAITTLHRSISHTGITAPSTLLLATAEGNAQKQDADELLAVLRAVHEAHGSGAEDLRAVKEAVGLTPVHFPADQGYKLADDPSGNPSEGKAEHQSVQNLRPFFILMPPMPL